MRLVDMLLREDFYTILQNTVKSYYQAVYGREVVLSYEKSRNCDRLIINGKLSFISRFPAPKGLRKFLLAEYNVRGSKVKFFAGKAAALSVGTFPQIGKLRDVYITKGALGKTVFISPQNRSVRFFDYGNMTVDCIIKSGFTDKYFTNQLNFRKEYHYDFMLPLLENGATWFREPILIGHPLARVTDAKAYQKGMEEARAYIGKLATDTLTYADSRAYTDMLRERISVLIKDACQRKKIATAKQTEALAELALQWTSGSPMQIPLCMSHGDFQSGNIWVDREGKTWLYDWETVGQRSVWYDSAVLNYSLRRAYGWPTFAEDTQPRQVCCCDPEKERTAREYQAIKGIVLLEDILFYLEDMLELPDTWGGEIYDGFIRRMEELLLS